jgi:hypothetical protein
LRVTRQWRNLKARKWHGFGYDTDREPGPGDLTIFCPACPQPGINLSEDWKARQEEEGTLMRSYVMDGNFKAEHMKMCRPFNDVAISNGHGFMVGEKRYKDHIKISKDVKLVS